MKENEFLDGVSNIESDVVERFISMDNKLQKKANKPKSKGIWLRFGAIAACFLLIVSAVIVVPMLREDDPGVIVPPNETNNDVGVNPGPGIVDDLPTEKISFDSLDKVNFYGGLKVIVDSTQNLSVENANIPSVSYLLSCNKDSARIMNLSETGSDDILDSQTAKTGNIMNSNNIMWDLTNEQMTITTAVYFKINVTENDTLLVSQIGAGEVEVMVTDLCIGINPFAMITFKNGDKYFSCLSEMYALKSGVNKFGSHLYIRGFEMFKDPVGEMTMFFNLVLNNATIEKFYWTPFSQIPSEATTYDIEIFSETIRISYNTYEFTLSELSSYWQNEDEPPMIPEDSTVSPPSGPPEIYDDGMLRYYLVDNEYYEVSGIYISFYTDVAIPDSLFGYPIKGVQAYAFRNYKYLRSIIIPDSVEYIGEFAFYNCDNLTSIKMPDNVTLGYGAFGKGDEWTNPETSGTLPPEDDTKIPPEDDTKIPPSDTISQTGSWEIIRSDGVKLELDKSEVQKILSMCENLRGEYAGSSEGHCGALYSIYYTNEEGHTDIYSLWDETTYTHGFLVFVGQSSYIYPDFMKDVKVNDILLTLDELYKKAGH